jgi:hypothetical protein
MRRRTPAEVVQHILDTAIRDERTGCLVSQLRKDAKGYARIKFVAELRAHQVIFFKGRIPANAPQALHACDNRACVEEAHLYAGDNTRNIQDKCARDRSGKKLKIAKVARVKEMLAAGIPQKTIAEMFGIHRSNVSRINTGARWSHVGGPSAQVLGA